MLTAARRFLHLRRAGQSGGAGVNRQNHRFQFSGKEIQAAAAREAHYHSERLAHWKAEQQKAIEAAKATGLDVREYDVTGGKQINVVVDPEVTNRLSTCASKINTHRQAADRYSVEADAYGTQPDRAYELDPDDVVYYRMAGGPREP